MSHQEDTLAGSKSIGFDYQYYYFFYLLLGLRHGQSVGLEVKDDLHIEFGDGRVELMQAKHSVQTTSDDSIIALTNLDTDLWKSLHNWSKFILEDSDPVKFLTNTKFYLVSNKSLRTNTTLNKISLLRNGEITVTEFKKYLTELAANTKNETIQSYISSVKSLSAQQLNLFAKSLEFTLGMDDLINQIQERLLEKIHIPAKVKSVYDSLNSELRDAIYSDIKEKKKIQFSFDDFTKRFGKCFQSALSTKLPVRSFEILLPSNPADQLFIKQLIDIGDIFPGEDDIIIQYTTQMLTLYNQLKDWEANGDLLPSETSAFDKNSILIWKNSFRSKYREIRAIIESGKAADDITSKIKSAALDCLDEMRKEILKIDDNILSTELSNGHFYLLSQQKNLGWHLDWQTKY